MLTIPPNCDAGFESLGLSATPGMPYRSGGVISTVSPVLKFLVLIRAGKPVRTRAA